MGSKEGTWQGYQPQEEEKVERRGKSSPSQLRSQKTHQDKSWLQRHCSSILRRDKQAQKAGQLFSGLMAMNVVFLGGSRMRSYIKIPMQGQSGLKTYFIWCHAKDCTQVQPNLTRCGLMLTLATNLLLWLSAVTNDSIHREIESELNRTVQQSEGKGHPSSSKKYNGTSSCKCPNTTACKVFQEGYILLYPFNTEYCLICCSMLYVMWKNVGRGMAQHHSASVKPKFKVHGVIFGPLLGISAIIIGSCTFMVYQIEATGSSPSHQAYILYYSYYIFLLPVMTIGALVGTIIHGLEERELDTLKNPTRSLDVILLMGTALGQIGISYFSIVAIVASNPRGLLSSITLAYSVSLIIQCITQNIFIIEGLHRQPLLVNEGPSHPAHSTQGSASTLSQTKDYQEPAPSTANEEKDKNEKETCEDSCQDIYNLEIRQEIRRLWIMPSFGAHPVFENGLEKSFYGYSTWFAVVNFGLPLGVFYRMHSVGDLLEVYQSA
ncbi:hypothetical protein JD844_011540 [Phrynosoma platyrhinos]|uniref:Otopetrin 3 n=1 Tax=Phrynosoma platyrhinos TaxID=52577 RepID=A0ABQ7TJ59_PHRPL|nr:hypothetical protein JD844_011540 [Phrynosoma platyrhinos]